MGRSVIITEKQFKQAYIRCHGVTADMAKELDVTRMTVYNYFKRWPRFRPKLRQRHRELSEKLFHEYRGTISLNELGKRHDISATMAKAYIEKYAQTYWQREKVAYPFPQRLSELKIVRVLMENEEKPIGKTIPTFEIGPRIGVHQKAVEDYLKRYAESRSQTATKAPEPNGRLRLIKKPKSRVVHGSRHG